MDSVAPNVSNAVIFSPAWSLKKVSGRLQLQRVSDGLQISVAGADVSRLNTLFRALASPTDLNVWVRKLSGIGVPQPRRLAELLVDHRVVRPFSRRSAVKVSGSGEFKVLVQGLLSDGGWQLPPIQVKPDLPSISGGRGSGQWVLAPYAWGVAASRVGARVCGHCALLRLLARRGLNGANQTRAWSEARLHRPMLRSFVTELLVHLQQDGLEDDGLHVVAQGQAATAVRILTHPDCPRCGGPPRKSRTSPAALRSLLLNQKAQTPKPHARADYLDAISGPLEVVEERGRRGQFPLNLPFLWGSVYLTRLRHGRAICLSTQGGIYASSADEELARVIALSEGVERLGARGAVPDLWSRASQERDAVPLRKIFGWASERDEQARRAFCRGLDVVSNHAALVPFESVVVGMPKTLYPEAVHREEFYSGTASHVTLAQAVMNATIEILKRDAFMISWYRRRALPRLKWPTRLSVLAQRRLRYLHQQGLDVELFDLSMDVPLPMLLLRITARRACGNWPRGGSMLIPAGGFSPTAVLEDALRLAGGQWVGIALNPSPDKDPLDPLAVRRMSRTAKFWPLIARYLNPAHRSSHSFLGSTENRFDTLADHGVPPLKQQMSLMRGWLAERGLPWIVVRLTTPSAQRAGFEVAKVVIPGLVAIAPARARVNLRLPRMKMPWSWSTLSGLNPDPHPLY
jgi:thiazole/oxazole-forming peptide maturase SagD family component